MSSDVRKTLDPGVPYSRTLKQYSIDEKLTIISHAKNHGNRAAGREFNVAESSIREWRKNENKLIHNRNNAAAGISASSAHPVHHLSMTPGSTIMNNDSIIHKKKTVNSNINNNNNYNFNNNQSFTKNGSLQRHQSQQHHLHTGGIFLVGNENNETNQQRNQENLMKLQLVQFAMLNMDFTHLGQLGPFLQSQHQRQVQSSSPTKQNTSSFQPLPRFTSSASSATGTPSSVSSSSTPPRSASPVLIGSGRRKPKCPQKIVNLSGGETPIGAADSFVEFQDEDSKHFS
ncbi:unnamed protein product [Caenorhabditis brenneri]